MKKSLSLLLVALLLCATVAAAFPFVSAAEGELLSATTNLASGHKYMFAISGITDAQKKSGEYAVIAEENTKTAGTIGLGYEARATALPVPARFLWTLNQVSGGWTVYSESTGKYMNLSSSGDEKAFLSTQPQTLELKIESGKLGIFVPQTAWRLRFTNKEDNSRWHCGTGTTSYSFTIYEVRTVDTQEYDNTGKTPLFTVATISDLHTDYGIQSRTSPIRQASLNVANDAKKWNPDVILVGGDMTSANDKKAAWSDQKITNSKNAIHNALSGAAKGGKVLYVYGNHECQASAMVNNSYLSSDWLDLMVASCGQPTASYSKTISGVNSLLAYRYTIGKMDIIGICTPYTTNGASASSGVYYSAVEWVEQQLKAIGKDKTVFIFCHYPLTDGFTNVEPGKTGNAANKMSSILNAYPNVIYCYGHLHTQGQIAYYQTSEQVAVTGAQSVGHNTVNSNGYISVHMGSSAYYMNDFQDGWLKADESVICQYNVIQFYSDHITFNRINLGTTTPGNKHLASYTVMRDMTAQFNGGSSTNTGTHSDPTTTDTTTNTTNTTNTVTTTDSGTVISGTDVIIDTTGIPGSETEMTDVTSAVTDTTTDLTATDATEESGTPAWVWWVVGIGAAVLLGGGAAAFFLLRKKK